MFRYDMQAEIWVYPGKGGWHFVTLPPELGARIKAAMVGMARPLGLPWRGGRHRPDQMADIAVSRQEIRQPALADQDRGAGPRRPRGWRHGQPDDRDAVMTTSGQADDDAL